jgi:hypothetical protein
MVERHGQMGVVQLCNAIEIDALDEIHLLTPSPERDCLDDDVLSSAFQSPNPEANPVSIVGVWKCLPLGCSPGA